MTATFDRLAAMLAKDYELPLERITPDATMESLGIDSLGVAELLFNVEDTFKIDLPTTPVQLVTVGEVAAFIDDLLHEPERRAPSIVAPHATPIGVP